MEKHDIVLPCSNGFTLMIKGPNLIVATKRQEETYPITNIQSFALKYPSLSYGKITFRTAQTNTAGIHLGFGIGAAVGAEQTFFYAKDDLDEAISLRDYIVNYSSTAAPAEVLAGKVVSVVDEIRGLKTLLDEGLLTQSEFDAKKKQLLGI